MTATSTVSVFCPECGNPATISLTTMDDDGIEQMLEFACPGGDELDAAGALRLWVSAHERADA